MKQTDPERVKEQTRLRRKNDPLGILQATKI